MSVASFAPANSTFLSATAISSNADIPSGGTICAVTNVSDILAYATWRQERLGAAGGRMRKVLIVALARKLLIALWQFASQGTIPEGAAAKPA